VEVRTYIQDLFNYLDRYENATAQFETEAFLQTYNGIIAVLNPLRQQRQEAVAVDEYLLERIMQSPLTSSDLRQLTVQILITFFESEADTDGQTNRAYTYCRGLRAVKQDSSYFEKHLVPLVCDEVSLNNNFRLKQFLLGEIVRYLVKFGRPLQVGLRPEDFLALSTTLQLVELLRRRTELGPNLLKDRTSLEFHLQRVDYFARLKLKGRLYERLLTEWGYMQATTFWSRVKAAVSSVTSGTGRAFASSGYFRLVINQRRPAYLFYSLIIVIFILIAIFVPMKWSSYGEHKLEEFQQRSQPAGTVTGH
jgi:hypothetical protein